MGRLQLRSDAAPRPMGPEKIAHGKRQADADRDIELMEIVSQVLPLLSHFHTDVGQKITPGQCTEKCVEDEPIDIYSSNTGRQGDESPDDRKHPAKKYRGIAIFGEPSIRHLDVFSRYQHIGSVSLDKRPASPHAGVVSHNRPRDVPESAGQRHAQHRELSRRHKIPGKWHDNFAG